MYSRYHQDRQRLSSHASFVAGVWAFRSRWKCSPRPDYLIGWVLPVVVPGTSCGIDGSEAGIRLYQRVPALARNQAVFGGGTNLWLARTPSGL